MSTKKESKEYKLYKDYKNNTQIKQKLNDVRLNKLRYGHITYGDVIGIFVDDEYLEINNSWLELIILMLKTYYSNTNGKNFIVNLANAKVISSSFDIDTTYGKIDTDKVYTAYKIEGTKYWIETTLDTEGLFMALMNLAKLLGMSYKDTKVRIAKQGIDRASTKSLELTEKLVDISKLQKELKTSIRISKIVLYGCERPVNSVLGIIIEIISLMIKSFGQDAMSDITSTKHTGITDKKEVDGYSTYKINNIQLDNKDIYIYTDDSIDGQIEFITKICNNVPITNDELLIGLYQFNKN